MKMLLDIGETQASKLSEQSRSIVGGQLLTPLTRYTRWSEVYAIDNGAFTQFRHKDFAALLERERDAMANCLFVAVPDVVGSARRTSEIWQYRKQLVPDGWPLAYVAQDGAEHIALPWEEFGTVFIGGSTHWKMSGEATAIVKAAKIIGKQVHVGRVNTRQRWAHFEQLGADTCDGSGAARFDWMLDKLADVEDRPLFQDAAIAKAEPTTEGGQ